MTKELAVMGAPSQRNGSQFLDEARSVRAIRERFREEPAKYVSVPFL
jgi:hypothetical protein